MSCLDATFTLTPRSPRYYRAAHDEATLSCFGADFLPDAPYDYETLYGVDRFLFTAIGASDPNLDYSQFVNRKKARFLSLYADLASYGAAKQLALIFGFETHSTSSWFPGRLLLYTDAAQLDDRRLVYGDNQFLLEIESLDTPVNLYFIHVGFSWSFKGLSGYVV
jgi:hypothetical protein